MNDTPRRPGWFDEELGVLLSSRSVRCGRRRAHRYEAERYAARDPALRPVRDDLIEVRCTGWNSTRWLATSAQAPRGLRAQDVRVVEVRPTYPAPAAWSGR